MLDKISNILKNGGVGLFPCDTVWGLIGLMTEENAEKIQKIKQRTTTQPLMILIPDGSHLKQLTHIIPAYTQSIIRHFWPGPLSLIFEKNPNISQKITGNGNSIGLRWPCFKPLNDLLHQIKQPLISTSANLSSEPVPLSYNKLSDKIKNQVQFIYDAVEPPLNLESTILDCRSYPPQLLREASLNQSQLAEVIPTIRSKQ